MAKNSVNYGSIRKLNQEAPKIDDKISKTIILSHAEAGDVSMKFGNPITRGGHTALRPAIDFSGGIDLYLDKALRQAVQYTGQGQQFQRKRKPDGTFASSQEAGAQSTAEEDQVDQQRDAKLRRHRMRDQLSGKREKLFTTKGMVPGVSDTTTPESAINDTNSQVIGSTMSGQPVYEDPFHSAHSNFSEQDHQEAAQLHAQMAQQSQSSGDMAGAAQHQSAAQSHTQQGQDQMAPGGRFMDSLFNQQGTPEVQPDDMGQFQDLLGMGQPDPAAGNPAIAGGVDPTMQQDPMMGQPPVGPDPMMAQQPEPMAPSPIDAMMGQPTQDPMVPNPMDAEDPMMGADPMAPDPLDPMMGQQPPMDPAPLDPMAGQAPMDPMAGQAPMDPMAQPPMAQPPMAQPPMDPMAGQAPMPQPPVDPMAGQALMDPMAQPPIDPMTGQPPMDPMMDQQAGPQDSLSGFLDQGKEGLPAEEPGPIPGMNHSATDGPVGPQTDIGESSAGGGIFDLTDEGDELSGEESGGGFPPEEEESGGGFPPSGEEDEEDMNPATIKAIAALRRYV